MADQSQRENGETETDHLNGVIHEALRRSLLGFRMIADATQWLQG